MDAKGLKRLVGEKASTNRATALANYKASATTSQDNYRTDMNWPAQQSFYAGRNGYGLLGLHFEQ